jgi:protein tyrosine/serine phosphatase
MAWFKRLGVSLVIMVLAIGVFTGAQYLSGNVHEVVPGQFYRSGQLSGDGFATVIQRYGIKTVINLRGPSQRQWYRDEVATAERLGVRHVNFKMSALVRLDSTRARALITLLRDAPKPLLVHCEGGADRSGLVSVIYAQQIAGIQEDIAELQLSPLFGHFGIPGVTGSYAMDQSWEDFEDANEIEEAGLM